MRSTPRTRRGQSEAVVIMVGALALACGAQQDGARRGSGSTSAHTERGDLTALTAPATRAMAERLAALPDPAMYSSRVGALERTPRPADLPSSLAWGWRRAELLLRAGRSDEAAAEIGELQRLVGPDSLRAPPEMIRDFREQLALIELWSVVEDGCLRATSACLFPYPSLAEPDLYPRLARAVATYRLLLERDPDDLVSLWLLNLGSMLAGEYPDSIPPPWRIPPKALEAEADIGRFQDIAPDLGVDVGGLDGGGLMEDLDGDGDLDLMASSAALSDQLRYFRNESGSFVESSAEAGLTGLTGGLNLIQADYDNDGDVDVLLLRGGWNRSGQPNSLLRNDGSGRFEDVTESAGMLASHPTQTAAWGDYDGDGLLDLFVGNESKPDANPPQINPGELYHNDGDGSFTNVAAEVGLDVVGFVKAALWGDYDNDGRIDLYLSLFGETNLLLWNAGRTLVGTWRFEDRTAEAGVAAPVESFPAWFWDYDNDGWLDLFVSGYRLQPADIPAEYLGRGDGAAFPRLYRNTRDGAFEDVTHEVHLDRVLYAMGSNFGDLDNDGWLDLYLGTGDPDYRALVPNRGFRSAAGERFLDVTTSGGFGHLGKGHGVAFGDLDGDGDQDIYLARSLPFVICPSPVGLFRPRIIVDSICTADGLEVGSHTVGALRRLRICPPGRRQSGPGGGRDAARTSQTTSRPLFTSG